MESHSRLTRARKVERTYTNSHQLSSLFDQEQGKSKQLSYKLLSINSHQLSSLFNQEQGKSKQLSSTFILVWPGARKVKTTLIQTLVYQLSSILIVVWPGVRRVKMAFLVTRIHIDFFLLLLSYVYTLRLIGPISYSSEYDLMVYPQKYSDRFLTNTFWKLLRYITCIKYEIGPINRSV